MPSKVYSAAVVGVEAFEVEIEVHAGWGNADRIAVVGLPDAAVKESKDRVTSAICNSALRWPGGRRITINLAPADVRKEGPSFDLPIALGMLKLEENNRLPDFDAFCNSCVEKSRWNQCAQPTVGPSPDRLNRNSISARSKVSSM
jgi:magnesium chelatase family protein